MTPYYQDDTVCACSCGGQPGPGRRFISGHNLRVMGPRTEAHQARIADGLRRAWETKRVRKPLGSRRLDVNGYRLVKVREGGGRWDKEHVLVAEAAIGRKLVVDEHVHHINGVKTDNAPENLFVCKRRVHSLAHASFGELLPGLIADGLVLFDRDTGRYRRA